MPILPLAMVPLVDSYTLVLALLFWAMFISGGNVITAIGDATGTFGGEQAGLIAGLGAGGWSLVVALTMPRFGFLFDAGAWSAAFLLATAISVSGYLRWLVLHRSAPAAGQISC